MYRERRGVPFLAGRGIDGRVVIRMTGIQ